MDETFHEDLDENTSLDDTAKANFISTCRLLFGHVDQLQTYTDSDIIEFLVRYQGHKGKATASVGEYLSFYEHHTKIPMEPFEDYFITSRFLQISGFARDGTTLVYCDVCALSRQEFVQEQNSSKTRKILDALYKDPAGKEKLLSFILQYLVFLD